MKRWVIGNPQLERLGTGSWIPLGPQVINCVSLGWFLTPCCLHAPRDAAPSSTVPLKQFPLRRNKECQQSTRRNRIRRENPSCCGTNLWVSPRADAGSHTPSCPHSSFRTWLVMDAQSHALKEQGLWGRPGRPGLEPLPGDATHTEVILAKSLLPINRRGPWWKVPTQHPQKVP